MENILKFAEENKDKSFLELPFCIVDSLILSQISYLDYGGSSFEKIYFDKKICEYYHKKANNYSDIVIKGMQTAEDDQKLIAILAGGGRHGGLRACRYVEEFCCESEKQFAAITFELGNHEYYIAFRGTDTSVVGWKEDFALSFQHEIPAQKAALEYVQETMLSFPGKFYIGGHSKGGNLAVYAAMNLPEAIQKRINAVYSFDGPGFLSEVYEKSNYENIHHIVCKVIPKSSIIGMILEEYADYRVIKSDAELYWQHNPYTWEVRENDFVYLDSEDLFSRLVKRSLDGLLEELTFEERRKIVDTVFQVIEDAGITSFYGFTEQRFEKIRSIMDQVACVEIQEKRFVYQALKRLFSIATEELRQKAREEGAAQVEKSAILLEKRLLQIEKILQSIQRGE